MVKGSINILKNGVIPGFLLLFLSSCQVNKYLDDQTQLLHRNKIQFESEVSSTEKDLYLLDIEQLYRQKGISKFNAWRYYYLSRPRKDTSALAKYLLKRSKVPEVYSESDAINTTRSINNYMVQRGYFEANTSFDSEEEGHWHSVTYKILSGKRYTVDTLIYVSQDPEIKTLLDSHASESFLKPGSPVDQQLYQQEVTRITSLMQNQGYANFFSNYISPLSGDSLNGKVRVSMEILPQKGNKPHSRFRVGEVRVFSDVSPDFPTDNLVGKQYSGIRFLSETNKYFIKPEALAEHIFLEPGKDYSRTDYDKTLRRLGRLAAVRFVSIRPEQSVEAPDILNYNIYMNPSFPVGLDGDIELNNSNISIINQRFLGVSGRIGLRHKNLFGGAEQNLFRISGGVELNTRESATRNNSNFFFRVENTLQLPKFYDVPGVFRLLNLAKRGNVSLLNQTFYRNLKEDGTTRFTVAADFVTQRLFYNYNSLNFTYGYDLIQANRKKYVINQTGINYFTPSFSDQFIERILNNNEFLRRSLVKQFFTGFFFRDISHSYTSTQNKAKETYTVFSNFEISGAEVALAGLIRNKPITQLAGIELAKYMRLDVDARYTRIYSERHSAAARINIGVAAPYGTSTEVPFVKQFFVGGGLSIRAWQLRSLGPGSYRDTTIQASSLDLFQTGDFKFEINGEYRYRLYGILETAVFVDAGNVWILRNDPMRPGAQFEPRRMLQDLAIGSGLGFRLVFDFFIIRLDWGVKIKNPYPIDGSYWARGNFRELTNLNLAISYPF
jgi:outer membrane protein insertion porin family